MGLSTDAIVAYGIRLDDEVYEENYNAVEKAALVLVKYFAPGMDWDSESEWKIANYLEDEHGITFQVHCSLEYSMYMLVSTKSVQRAYRGYPVTLSFGDLESQLLDGNWEQKLREAAEMIDGASAPCAWHLMSYMG